jgi:hypothetical protein
VSSTRAIIPRTAGLAGHRTEMCRKSGRWIATGLLAPKAVQARHPKNRGDQRSQLAYLRHTNGPVPFVSPPLSPHRETDYD